jgi:hypothetical protein
MTIIPIVCLYWEARAALYLISVFGEGNIEDMSRYILDCAQFPCARIESYSIQICIRHCRQSNDNFISIKNTCNHLIIYK